MIENGEWKRFASWLSLSSSLSIVSAKSLLAVENFEGSSVAVGGAATTLMLDRTQQNKLRRIMRSFMV
jgi:hypothetical protein